MLQRESDLVNLLREKSAHPGEEQGQWLTAYGDIQRAIGIRDALTLHGQNLECVGCSYVLKGYVEMIDRYQKRYLGYPDGWHYCKFCITHHDGLCEDEEIEARR